MKLHVWGTDFRRSSAQFRAKFARPEEARKSVVQALLDLGFKDLVYLSTCNRVEFYTTAPDHFVDTRALWLKVLEYFQVPPESYYQGFHYEGKSALRHLLRVACSLESLAVGETQILGQLKEAVAWHKREGFPLDNELEKFFQLAFETARKVRAQTGIGEKSVSVASLGMSILQNEGHPITCAAVIGRSPISRIVVQWLSKNHPDCRILWVNRTVEALSEFAETEHTELWSLKDFLEKPPVHSHLFTATSSIEPVFTDAFFEKLPVLPKRVFDFAQPQDVQIEKDEFKSAISITDLEELEIEAAKNQAYRQLSVDQAESLIAESLRTYIRFQKETPLIKEFSSVEPLLMESLEQALHTVGVEHARPEKDPSQWARNVVKKQMHHSREHLRSVLQKLAGETTDPVL